jgi:hypothetical protein
MSGNHTQKTVRETAIRPWSFHQTTRPQPWPSSPVKAVEICPHCQMPAGEGRVYVDELALPGERQFGKTMPCPKCQAPALLETCGLKTHETGLTLDSLITAGRPGAGEMKAAARRFIRRPLGFMSFFGGCGNGKTIAAMAVVNECLKNGVQAQYVTAKILMDYLREAFDPKIMESDAGRIRKLASVSVLVIDEFADVRNSPYTSEMQKHLINERYRDCHNLGTVFCWNETWDDLPWPNIVSRLREFDWVENRDHDLRRVIGQKKKELAAADRPNDDVFETGESQSVFARNERA